MANGDRAEPEQNWFNDSQRIIALIFVILFVGLMSLYAWIMWKNASVNDVVEMQKQLINALINIVMVVVGFFFGASKTGKDQLESQSRVAEKLAEKAALPVPPGPPMQPTAAVVAWWSLLTDAERAAIEAAAVGAGDARVLAFIEAAKAGAAAGDDLDYLVSKGLLTPERAAEIRKAGVT